MMNLSSRTNSDLQVFYIDDGGVVRGPFPAEHAVNWYRVGHFQEKRLLRFTDNGKLDGDSICFEMTVEELKKHFGAENPIPTNSNEIYKKKFSGFYDNSLTLSNAFVVSDDSKTASTSYGLKKPRNDNDSSLPSSSSHPIVEPKPKKMKLTEPKKVEGPPEKKKRYLPFYTGDNKNRGLQEKQALHAAHFLANEYKNLSKEERNDLHDYYSDLKLPKQCKYCQCPLPKPSNFLTHVTSQRHIRATFEDGQKRFTYNRDFWILKDNMEEVKKTPIFYFGPATSKSKRIDC